MAGGPAAAPAAPRSVFSHVAVYKNATQAKCTWVAERA